MHRENPVCNSRFSMILVALALVILQVAAPTECLSDSSVSLMVSEVGEFPVPAWSIVPGDVTVNGKAYFFGGQVPWTEPYVASGIVRVFDLETESWSELPFLLPYGLMDYGQVGSYLEGHFFLGPMFASGDSGGWGSHNRVIDVDLVGGTANESGSFPEWRVWQRSGCAANGSVFFFGGHAGADLSAIYAFDPISGTVQHVANMMAPGQSVRAFLGTDGWIYYWRGALAWQPFNGTIERLNPTTFEVQDTGARLPPPSIWNGWNPLHAVHVRDESAIYFLTLGPTPTLFKYAYLTGLVEDTGETVNVPLGGFPGTQDMSRPGVLYVLGDQWSSDPGAPVKLYKIEIQQLGQPPVSDFAWSPVSPNPGQAVEFQDTSAGEPTSWTWDFGDGAVSQEQNPIHLYSGWGDHTVTLTVSNSRGSNQRSMVVHVNAPPIARAGGDIDVGAGELCLASVQLDGADSWDPENDPLSFNWSGAFGTVGGATPTVSLGLGVFDVLLEVTDQHLAKATDNLVITVTDRESPTVTGVQATPELLWPPNHRMVHVELSATTVDACSPVSCRVVDVASSEPVDGGGDGDSSPDWEIISDLNVRLRAERSGSGAGRIYTITLVCGDGSGNTTTSTTSVVVPHNR